MESYKKPLLIIIILFSLAIRLYKIQSFPFFPFGDEIHPATSIISYLTTGKDVDGKIHAFFFDPMMYTPPIIGISMIPLFLVFGANVITIRLPGILYSVLSIIILFKITQLLTKNGKISLISCLIYALIPWNFHYSRVGWEPPSLLFFFLLTVLFFLKSRTDKNFIIPSFLFASLSIYSYSTAMVFSPILMIFFPLLFFSQYRKSLKEYLTGLTIFIIIVAPFVINYIQEPLMHDRGKRIFVATNKTLTNSIETFSIHYLQNISPSFLFLKGDPNIRHNIGNHGELFSFMFPFILLGFLYFLKRKDQTTAIILFWFLLYPLASALTDDGNPHATRSLIGAPLFSLLTATGFLLLKNLRLKKPLYTLIAIIAVIQIFSYYKSYFLTYPQDLYAARAWDYGHGQVFEFAKNNLQNYDKICFNYYGWWATDRFILYYFTPFNNPNVAYNNNKSKPNAVIIYNNEDKCRTQGSLLVLPVEKKLTGIEPIYKIFGLDGKEEYEIYSF